MKEQIELPGLDFYTTGSSEPVSARQQRIAAERAYLVRIRDMPLVPHAAGNRWRTRLCRQMVDIDAGSIWHHRIAKFYVGATGRNVHADWWINATKRLT